LKIINEAKNLSTRGQFITHCFENPESIVLLKITEYLIEQILAHPEALLKDSIGIHWTFDKVIGHQTFVACDAILEYDFSTAGLDHSGDGLGCCCQEVSNKNLLFEIPEEIFEV
jgi:UDP-N-acetyl-D-mannosaminuronic acid transferase (WecB/TagA/CpsF family)